MAPSGLCRSRFVTLSGSSESFVCLSCCLKPHTKEIWELWDDTKHLKEEIAVLKLAQSMSVPTHADHSVQF